MADTNRANVELIAPELSSMPNDLWTLILADATDKITYQAYGKKEEIAQRYYVAHVMSVLRNTNGGDGSISGSQAAGALTRERVSEIEKEYSDLIKDLSDGNRFDTTPYGAMFNTIRKGCLIKYCGIAPLV